MSKVEISNLSIEEAEGVSIDSALIALLERSLLRVQKYLRRSAGDPIFSQRMAVAFGEAARMDSIKKDWLEGNFAMMPSIEILTQEEFCGANGAFSGQTNRIYLSEDFLSRNATNVEAVAGVLIEEIGHWVDQLLNEEDSLGDEGAIFAALVLGESLSDVELAQLKAEDDHGIVSVNGGNIAVEQQNFTGTEGNDTIAGTSGDDVINGLGGNDTITQGNGVNIVDGGDGSDTLIDGNFSSLSNNQNFNDSGTTYPAITLPDGTTISNIEYFTNLTTGSGNDTISYSLRLNNNLNSGSGDDTINGGFGLDTVDGGTGNDLLIVDYSNSAYFNNTARVSTSSLFSNGVGGFNGYYGRYAYTSVITALDQVNFSNIERFQITGTSLDDIIGTASGNDTINGGDGNDYIDSGAGNDVLTGGDGNDILDGGTGNDIITGGAGNDTITQGSGLDVIDGGSGLDTLVNANLGSVTNNLIFDDTGTTQITLTLSDGTTISNMEYFPNLITGSGNETINYSLRVDNIINTGSGNDTINGGLGVDTVDGGAGDDVLVVDYSNNNSVSVYPIGIYSSSLTSNGAGGFNGSYSAVRVNNLTLLIYDIVYFSNIERFQIIGTRFGETIVTGSGNDTINGYGGIDIINAGAGIDKIILADAIKQYYDDLITTTDGRNDYANIIGFETQDIIQLAGSPTLYSLNVVGGITELYLDKPASEPDELIAIIEGLTNLVLTSDNFIYVQPVNLSVSTTTGTEVGTTLITVTATTLSPVLRNQSVDLTVSGTATSADYTLTSNTIIIPDGSNTGTVTFTVVNDTLIEPTETATLILTNPSSGLVLGGTTSQNITLINDDFPFVNLSVSTNAATEAGSTVVTVTATASSPVLSAQTVNLAVTGTGITTGDYTLSSSFINIPNGGTIGTRTFTIVNDTLVEGPETATIAISSISSGLLLGITTSQAVIITDNDFPRVNLSVSSNTGSEAGSTIVTVTANASDPVIGNQTVDLAISGTGITTSDYNLSNSTIALLNGQTTGTVTFTIVNDTLIEPTETATLTLTNLSSGLVLGGTTSQSIILINDDFPSIDLSVSTNAATEAGTTVVTVTVTASSPVLSAQTVNLSVTGTGITSADYTLSSSIINIPNGGTTGTRTFTIVNDTLVEGSETATIAISSISSGLLLGISTSQAVTITDNDFPRVNLSVSSNTGSEAGSTIVIVTANASDPVIGNQTVDLAISGTGITTSDYNLSNSTIALLNGQTTGTVTFAIVNDTLIEPTETATLTLTNLSSGLVLGGTTSQSIILINDDFPSIDLSVSTNAATEAGATVVTVTATASSPVLSAQTVNLTVTGTGITTGDYSLSNNIITIPDGQTTGTASFAVINDDLVEGTETAVLTLAAPSSGLVLGSTTSQNIILTDNDFAPPVDGNLDGIPDDEQNNIVSIQTPNNDYVTFAGPQGQPSANVQATPNPDPATAPSNVDFTLGFFEFNIPQVSPGSSTTLTLFLSQGAAANSYWKYGATPDNTIPHWYDFAFDSLTNTGATFQDINGDGQNEIILHFVDGQRGDDDLIADGKIVDPGAPAVLLDTFLTLSVNSVMEDDQAPLHFLFCRTGPTTSALTVHYTVAGTATLGIDYTGIAATPATKMVTFAANAATATVIVDPTTDVEIEPDETVAFTLAAGSGYSIGTTAAVVGTILNDDTVIENQGNIKLLKRGDGMAFVETGAATRQQINSPWNSPVGSDSSEWQMVAAEMIAGTNQILWRNNTSNFLHLWGLDANWNWQASSGADGFNTPRAWELETSFQVDATRDGITGVPFTTMEAQGNTKLLRRGDGLAFVDVGGARQEISSPWNSPVGSDSSEWQMVAAEMIAGTNQILWRNNTSNFLHLWSLDANWTWQASSGADPFNTPRAWELETSFQVDATRDGIIGRTHLNDLNRRVSRKTSPRAKSSPPLSSDPQGGPAAFEPGPPGPPHPGAVHSGCRRDPSKQRGCRARASLWHRPAARPG